MGRPRKPSQTSCYHIVARGNNQQPVFLGDSDLLAYRGGLEKYKNQYGIEIFHYCLMTNHVHLVLRVGSLITLSRFMHDLQRWYFYYLHKKNGFQGHLWESRFGSFPIETESYLLECGRYVERNPVKAEMVNLPEDYLWSSYRFYAEGKPDSLLTLSPLYSGMGVTTNERQENYRKYVCALRNTEYRVLVPGTLV